MKVRWETSAQHMLVYTGSGDGLETWVDINLGRNYVTAKSSYDTILRAAQGKAYYCSPLIDFCAEARLGE